MASLPSSHRRPPRGRWISMALSTSLLALCLACTEEPASDADSRESASVDVAERVPPVVGGQPFRAFTPDSWWNSPVPTDAPAHPEADAILEYMSTAKQARDGCVRLAGAGDDSWGQPVFWAAPGDREYDVTENLTDAPRELRDVRIPQGATGADNSDGSMTLFDVERGYTMAFTDAEYDAEADDWSVSGATVTYLDSNGLHAGTGESSDERNVGTHRGNNAAVMMVRLDEVEAGRIDHVLKVASGPEASEDHVFPMTGSDGDSRDADAPPQGLRFRIKPSVDLEEAGLEGQALVIATALQKYGFYIGDSGGATALKLEDTEMQGRGQLWDVEPSALCELPLTPDWWDVLPEGYQPPG